MQYQEDFSDAISRLKRNKIEVNLGPKHILYSPTNKIGLKLWSAIDFLRGKGFVLKELDKKRGERNG